MARPKIPLGTHGEIWHLPVGDRIAARVKVHDLDGKVRTVQAIGKTKTAASNALKVRLRDRQTPQSRDLPITRSTTLRDLLAAWLAHHAVTAMPSGEMRAPATIEFYQSPVRRLSDRLGDLQLHAATTAVLEVGLGGGTPAQWRADRKTLSLAFAYAVRMGAVDTNPVTGTTSAPGSRKAVRALTVDEVREVRKRIKTWQGESKYGPKRMPELGFIVDVMLGTGLRISDVLALRWPDVDLKANPPTLTATIQKARGQRLTFILPKFTADTLATQRAKGLPSADDLVFPTRNGTVMSRQNVSARWREARGDDLGWVSPHTFRKTASTLIAAEYGAEGASKQLGHSGTAVTERHYIERGLVTPDHRTALDKLAP